MLPRVVSISRKLVMILSSLLGLALESRALVNENVGRFGP
jgi:hypothetical protein